MNLYLDDIGEGSLFVGVRVKRWEPRPLGPAALSGRIGEETILGLLLISTGESQVTELSDEISITSSISPLIFTHTHTKRTVQERFYGVHHNEATIAVLDVRNNACTGTLKRS